MRCCFVHIAWFSFVIHCLAIKWEDFCCLEFAFYVYMDNDFSRFLSIQPTNSILFGSLYWFLTIAFFSFLLKAILKGLKQLTLKGYMAWEVWKGNVYMSNPNCYAYFTISKVTCEPWSFRINKWWLDKKLPSIVDLLKNDKKSLNR